MTSLNSQMIKRLKAAIAFAFLRARKRYLYLTALPMEAILEAGWLRTAAERSTGRR
jgi:hypothetical protein